MWARISWSALAFPGGCRAFHFHWSQRAEVVKVPSFLAKSAAGSRKTSVWILEASGPSYSLGAFQKMAVSVSTFSTTTSHFSFERAATIYSELGPSPTGFMPNVIRPAGPGSVPPAIVELPRYMSSKMYIQEEFPSTLGSQE